jgi:hypothetical protein
MLWSSHASNRHHLLSAVANSATACLLTLHGTALRQCKCICAIRMPAAAIVIHQDLKIECMTCSKQRTPAVP